MEIKSTALVMYLTSIERLGVSLWAAKPNGGTERCVEGEKVVFFLVRNGAHFV